MVEPVVVASYPSTLLDEPDPSPGVKRKTDSGNKTTGQCLCVGVLCTACP